MKKLKLSIIIPYYNADAYIGDLLNSLLNQGLQEDEYEIIVVDDESTQEPDTLKRYCAEHSNIYYLWQKNARQSAARNHGIENAKGEYVFFCDNDDKVAAGVFGQLYDIASSNNLDMLFFNRLMIDEDAPIPQHRKENYDLEAITTGQQYIVAHPHSSMGPWHYLTRRAFIFENSLRFMGVIHCEDTMFLIDSLAVAKRCSKVDVDVYYWVQHPKSVSHHKEVWAKGFIGGMLYCNDHLKVLVNSDGMDADFVQWIEKGMHGRAFSIMHNCFRFMSMQDNRAIFKKLRETGEYPLKKTPGMSTRNNIIRIVINRQRIYYMCYRLYHLVNGNVK